MKRILAIALIISTAVMGGCANNMTSRDYNEATAGKKMKVELGVVESIRDVKINGKATPWAVWPVVHSAQSPAVMAVADWVNWQ